HLKNSPSQNSRKKSAKLVEIEDINVGFDTGEPETVAPAQEAVEVPKKSLKNSPSQNSRKKSAKLVEIEDINVGFDTGEPETVGTQTLPAQEEKPVEEPKKNLKNSPSQNSWKKSAKLVEIEDINVGFDTGEPKAVEMATPSAQEEKPAEEPKKSLKNSPSENSRKKSAKLVEIEDINVGFDTGEPETTVSVQQDHSADTPVEKPKKKAALIEIEDINVEFDSEE
ncbi:MAG: hypothetical protein J1E06_09575, partial [Acutalibacter sp.]|nr:hypothetical protein [Acutalibacter sp.]